MFVPREDADVIILLWLALLSPPMSLENFTILRPNNSPAVAFLNETKRSETNEPCIVAAAAMTLYRKTKERDEERLIVL